MTLKVLNALFFCRVRIYKNGGVDNLDAWPAVKVSNFLHLSGAEYGLFTNDAGLD